MSRWHDISANRRALAYILFSVIVLGAMFLGGIGPVKQKTAEMREKKVNLEARIEKQRILQPIYQRLVETRLQANTLKENLPAVEGPHEVTVGIHTAPVVLADMAGESGVLESRFSPVPASVSADSDLVLMEGDLQGQYRDFRDFLINLAAFPGFYSVESLVIRSTASTPEYKVKVWMAVE